MEHHILTSRKFSETEIKLIRGIAKKQYNLLLAVVLKLPCNAYFSPPGA